MDLGGGTRSLRPVAVLPVAAVVALPLSSSMISLQRSTHSSQIYTAPGRAMSRRTWSWFFPQNEQWYWTRLVRLVAKAMVPLCLAVLGRPREQLVHEPVFFRALRVEVEVAVEVPRHPLDGLARVAGDDVSDDLVVAKNLLRRNFNIGRLAPRTTKRLVHVHRGVRQSEAFPLRPGAQQHRRHRGGLPDCDGRNIRLDQLHRVVNRQAGRNHAPWGVDVQADVALRVLALQVKQLRHNQVRNLVVDRRTEEDNPLFQQQRENVERALRAWARFDHCGNDVVHKRANPRGLVVHACSSCSSPLATAARRSSVFRERRFRRIVETPSSVANIWRNRAASSPMGATRVSSSSSISSAETSKPSASASSLSTSDRRSRMSAASRHVSRKSASERPSCWRYIWYCCWLLPIASRTRWSISCSTRTRGYSRVAPSTSLSTTELRNFDSASFSSDAFMSDSIRARSEAKSGNSSAFTELANSSSASGSCSSFTSWMVRVNVPVLPFNGSMWKSSGMAISSVFSSPFFVPRNASARPGTNS